MLTGSASDSGKRSDVDQAQLSPASPFDMVDRIQFVARVKVGLIRFVRGGYVRMPKIQGHFVSVRCHADAFDVGSATHEPRIGPTTTRG